MVEVSLVAVELSVRTEFYYRYLATVYLETGTRISTPIPLVRRCAIPAIVQIVGLDVLFPILLWVHRI